MELSSLISIRSMKLLALAWLLSLAAAESPAMALDLSARSLAKVAGNELRLAGEGETQPIRLSNVALAVPGNAVVNTDKAFRDALKQLEGQDFELFKSLLEPQGAQAPTN